MLEALGLMRDGREGEGCSIFGSITVLHVAGAAALELQYRKGGGA
jgi:hypothetical protein